MVAVVGRAIGIVLAAAATAALAVAVVWFVLGDGPGGSSAAREVCRPSERLTWAPPRLTNPKRIKIRTGSGIVELDDKTDYIVELADRPVRTGTRLSGGRNIVVIGGEIKVRPGPNGETQPGLSIWDQADGATIHIEGVRFGGAIHDGITLQQPNDTTIQIQNVRVENLQNIDEVNWRPHHPDVVQTWTGPSVLRIDRLTGYSPYQGLFFKPEDRNYRGPGGGHVPDLTDLRNVNLRVRPDRVRPASRMLWVESDFPLKITNAWIDPGDQGLFAYPNNETWKGFRRGVPETGDFVTDMAGSKYKSPGYGDLVQPTGKECSPGGA